MAADVRVLHVDDDPDSLALTSEFLAQESDHLLIDTATSVADGLVTLAETAYDCIISDYDMPGQNGLDFLEAVRQQDDAIPFILYTGKGSEAVASDAITSGVTDYLQKEVGTSQYTLLANRIENAVSAAKTERRLRESESRFREIAELSPHTVFRIDTDSEFTYVSPAIESLLQVSADELLGAPFDNHVVAGDRDAVADAFGRVYQGESIRELDVDLVDGTGHIVNAELSATPVKDGDEVALVQGLIRNVTHEKTRQERLAQQAAFLRNSPDSFFVLSRDGQVKYQSTTAADDSESEIRDFQGESVISHVHPDDRERVKRDFERLLADPSDSVRSEFRLKTLGGDWRWHENRASNFLDDEIINGVLVVSREISVRKAREQELERQLDLFEQTQRLANIGAWEGHPDESKGYYSDKVYEIYAADSGPSSTPDIDIQQYFHPDDQEIISAALAEAIETGTPYDTEVRIIDGNGTEKWVRTTGDPQFDGDTFVRIRGTIQDITERRERERELERQNERLSAEVERRKRAETRSRSLFENFPEPALAYVYENDEPQIVSVNQGFADVFGYTTAQASGKHIEELIVPPESVATAQRLNERVRDGEAVTAEVRRQTTAGVREFQFQNIVVPDDTEIDGYGMYTDITEQKQRERDLQRNRERYQSLFENNPLVIWEQDFAAGLEYIEESLADVADLEGYLLANPAELQTLVQKLEIIDINQNAVEYYDAPSKEVLRQQFHSVFTDDALEELVQAIVAIAEGEHRFRTETVARTLSGERKHELLEIYAPQDQSTSARVYTTGVDITERKQQERELKRKNRRLEEFAGVVSHDLRNPLTVLQGSLELAETTGDTAHFERGHRAIGRMERLIDDLLTLAREGRELQGVQAIELAKLTERCWDTVSTADATLLVDTDTIIEADSERLQQLLENLIRNAVEHGSTSPDSKAHRDGGDDTPGGVTVTVGELADSAGFYVADDGPGIPADERKQVFKSGFSTTPDGTGFGLSIVESVATAHGWDVRATESASGGTRIEVFTADASSSSTSIEN